jgi:hypothetical protein
LAGLGEPPQPSLSFTLPPAGRSVPGFGFCFFTFLPWPFILPSVQFAALSFFFAFFRDLPLSFGTVHVGPAGLVRKVGNPF